MSRSTEDAAFFGTITLVISALIMWGAFHLYNWLIWEYSVKARVELMIYQHEKEYHAPLHSVGQVQTGEDTELGATDDDDDHQGHVAPERKHDEAPVQPLP